MNLRYATKISLLAIGIFFLCSCFSYADELLDSQAIEYFEQAIEQQKSGDLEYAKTLYQKAIYINPEFKQAYNNLGTIYVQMGDSEKAEQYYRRAIAIDDKYEAAWKNLSFIYAGKKDFEKFFEYWKKGAGFLDINTPFIIEEEVEDSN